MLKVLVKSILIATVCLFAFAAPGRADEARDVDVPAGDMLAALESLARQADIDLVYQADQIKGIKTQGVRGKLTAQQAISGLLQGTTLKVSTDASSGAMMITPAERRAESQPVATSAVTTVAAGETTLARADADASAGTEGQASGPVNGTITGRVTDTAAGNLSGALVRILETDQVTQTDTLGAFRLRGLAPGEYTLSISYIGYTDKLWRVNVDGNEPSAAVYPLEKSAWELAEVTVFGSRSARAKALNQQRTAANSSSVISSDVLGNFTDATVAEALRRAPGITFQRDLRTGEGQNVVIRGLEPNMNSVKLNGLHLPAATGLGSGRAATLNTLLADSVETITINETLLPSQDSEGTGGLIEIVTKTPLNRPHRYASLGYEAGRKGGDFSRDRTITATVSGTFGAERDFGLSLSAQRVDRDTKNYRYDVGLDFGQYLPLDAFGGASISSPSLIDPRVAFPYGEAAQGAYVNSINNYAAEADFVNDAVTLSGAWQVSAGTHLRLDLQKTRAVQDFFSRSLNMTFLSMYQPLPVAAVGGETRQALLWSGLAFAGQNYSLVNDIRSAVDTHSFEGSTVLGRFEHHYRAGYVSGTGSLPDDFYLSTSFQPPSGPFLDAALLSPRATDPGENRIISVFGPRSGRGYPLPLLSDAGFAFFNDSANYALSSVFPHISRSSNERHTGEWSTRFNLDRKWFKYLEAGANFESSDFESVEGNGDVYADDVIPIGALGLSLRDTGIGSSGIALRGFNLVPRSQIEQLNADLEEIAASGHLPIYVERAALDPSQRGERLREKNLASYLEARVDFGKLQMIGGVRMSRVDALSRRMQGIGVIDQDGNFDQAYYERSKHLVTDGAVQTDYLPRLQLNYRQTENVIFRGGYYLTVARPDVSQLSTRKQLRLVLTPDATQGPNGPAPLLEITTGNPALKPALTHNFDLSAERYSGRIGLMKLSLFYKQIENLLKFNMSQGITELDGIDLPDDDYFNNLPDNIVVTGSRPENGDEPARNWGATVTLERQLSFLPGIWSGLGLSGNFTYSRNSNPFEYTWLFSPLYDADGNLTGTETRVLDLGNDKFEQQSLTAGVTYNLRGIDASLYYNWQGSTGNSFAEHGLLGRNNGGDTLDLRVEYQPPRWGGHFRIYLEGADLLRGTTSPDMLSFTDGPGSVPNYYSGATFFGGRTLRLGTTATF